MEKKEDGAALQQERLKQLVFHFTEAFAALSGNSLEGRKSSPIWCLYHLQLFFFKDKEFWRSEWENTNSSGCDKRSLRYESILSCSISLLQQHGCRLFRPCWSLQCALRMTFTFNEWVSNIDMVAYSLIYSFPLVNNYAESLKSGACWWYCMCLLIALSLFVCGSSLHWCLCQCHVCA